MSSELVKPSDEFRIRGDFEDLEDLDKLSKLELKEKAKKEFNISDDDWKTKVEVEPMFSKETIDDIANIDKYFADRLKNTLSGKRLVRTGKGEEKWVQNGKAVAGSLLIDSAVGIIETFANKSMLISNVRDQDFNMQFEDAFKKISDLVVMPNTYVDVNSIRIILKQFKDTFWNIGSILGKTGKNMESYFLALNKYSDETDNKYRSKLGD